MQTKPSIGRFDLRWVNRSGSLIANVRGDGEICPNLFQTVQSTV